MPRTLNATLDTALSSGTFQPYFLVSAREVGEVTAFFTAQPVMFRLSGVNMTVKYKVTDVPIFEGFRPEEVEFKITRGVTVAGVNYTIDTSWHYGLSASWDGHFETVHASMLPNLRATVAGDQTYEQVIDAVVAEYGKTASFKDESAAWLDYQFMGAGKQVQLNRGRDFLTLIRQKYMIYATDNGGDEILFHGVAQSYGAANHTLNMERFEIDSSSHPRRLLSRDETSSVTYSGNADAPLWNLGYLESTDSHPASAASTRVIIKPIAPHLKYLTFDVFTFTYARHYPETGYTSTTLQAEVVEEFDKDRRELAWSIQLSSFDWAGGTEGGALPGTIEAAAPYTPLNTSKFGGILDATDNNIQAAMETIDDHTHALSAEEVQDIIGQMVTGNTETGITVTYQDSDGTIDFELPAEVYFSAYLGSAQVIATGTNTVAICGTELTDSGGYYNTTTGKFTPLLAGTYEFKWTAVIEAIGDGKGVWLGLRKNGGSVHWGNAQNSGAGSVFAGAMMVESFYLDGVDDYVEAIIWHNHGSNRNLYSGGTTQYTRFSGRRISTSDIIGL